jgi:hypothetical protein
MTQRVWRLSKVATLSLADFCFRAQPEDSQELRSFIADKASEDFRRHWELYCEEFEKAIFGADLDEAHRIWSFAAETWLFLNQHDCPLNTWSPAMPTEEGPAYRSSNAIMQKA